MRLISLLQIRFLLISLVFFASAQAVAQKNENDEAPFIPSPSAALPIPSKAEVSKPIFGSAETSFEIREKVQQAQKARLQIEQSDVAKRKILGTIYTIQQRMKKISHEKNTLTDELFHVQGNVQSVAKLIAVIEREIDGQRKALKKRLSALYKLSGESYVAILFSQESSLDMDEALRNLKTVTQKDYALIRSYQENVTLYKSQRKKLKYQVEHLVSLESRIKKQEGLLAQEHKQKSQIVSELDHNRNEHIRKITILRADVRKNSAGRLEGPSSLGAGERVVSSESSGALAELLKPSIFEQKGQLPSPVVGKVVREFGMVTNDHYKTQLSHKGWLYQAPKGSLVSSIFDGTVSFANWIKGYGQVVIIDHSDHYYTVYAHIARLKVKTGDTISKGQTIAEIGAEVGASDLASQRANRRVGDRAGPALGTDVAVGRSKDSVSSRDDEGLYFEIRHFSEPENPAHWLAARGVKMALIDFSLEKSLNRILNETNEHGTHAPEVARAALRGAAIVEERQ